MKKIIGFDIDGVLTTSDFNAWEMELIQYFQLPYIEDPEKRSLQVRYNLTREQMIDFYHKRSHMVFPQLIMREDANTLLHELHKNGFTIILITARTESPETPRWLKTNDIPYDLLIHEHDKLPSCLEYQVELFVEDNLENATLVSSTIPVLLMDTEYNQHDNLPNLIHRVHNFSEIREFIMNFFQKQIA